jgi:hypothetical protein
MTRGPHHITRTFYVARTASSAAKPTSLLAYTHATRGGADFFEELVFAWLDRHRDAL